jgi:hypothetical protein
METSDLCKESIKMCEECHTKFPDDTSLMKHIGLKKQCLARYNLGHADPSVVAGIPSGQNESAGEGSITTLSFQGRKDVSLPPGVRDNSGYINSFNTYAFPHRNNSNSSSYVYSSHKDSGGHQQSNGTITFPSQYEHDDGAQFLNHGNASDTSSDTDDDARYDEARDNETLSDDDGSWLPGYNSDEISSSDEEENINVDVERMRESLKTLAGMMRRKNMATFHLPTDVQMVLDLYQRIVGNGGSLKTYDTVLDWATHHSLIGDHIPRCKAMLKQVSEAVYGKEFLTIASPKQQRVALCTGRVAEVTTFDIRTLLVQLLCNEDLMKRENLVFGDSNFTDVDAGIPLDNEYNDVNSGSWWRDTAHKIKQDHPDLQHRSVIWPLIFFIDGVAHGEFTNLSQEPVLMSFSSFKRSIRNKPQAWRPLAYIDYKGNMKGKVSPCLSSHNL